MHSKIEVYNSNQICISNRYPNIRWVLGLLLILSAINGASAQEQVSKEQAQTPLLKLNPESQFERVNELLRSYRTNLRKAEQSAALLADYFIPGRDTQGNKVVLRAPRFAAQFVNTSEDRKALSAVKEELMLNEWNEAQNQVDQLEVITKQLTEWTEGLKKDTYAQWSDLEKIPKRLESLRQIASFMDLECAYGKPLVLQNIDRSYPLPLSDLRKKIDRFERDLFEYYNNQMLPAADSLNAIVKSADHADPSPPSCH